MLCPTSLHVLPVIQRRSLTTAYVKHVQKDKFQTPIKQSVKFRNWNWKMEAKIAGMDAIFKKANAIGVALMVGVVEKVGLEMDVMALLGGLGTDVCLNH